MRKRRGRTVERKTSEQNERRRREISEEVEKAGTKGGEVNDDSRRGGNVGVEEAGKEGKP